MKKFIVPVLIIQSVVCIGFLIFAIVQKIEAKRQREVSIRNEKIAEKQKSIAVQEKEESLKVIRELEAKVNTLQDSLSILKRT